MKQVQAITTSCRYAMKLSNASNKKIEKNNSEFDWLLGGGHRVY